MRGKDLLECMEHIDDALIEEALNPVIAPRQNIRTAKWGMAAACLIVAGVSAATLWSHQNIKEEDSGGNENEVVMSMTAEFSTDISAENAGNINERNQLAEASAGSAQPDGMADKAENERKDAVMDDLASGGTVVDKMESDNASVEDMKSATQEALKINYTEIHDYSAAGSASSDDVVPEKGMVLYYQRLQKAIEYYSAQEKDATDYAYTVVIELFGDIETDTGSHYVHLNQTDDGNELVEQEYRRLIELGYSVRLSEDFLLMGTFTKEEFDTFDVCPEYGYVFRFEND